jgi:hypothetical protein
MDVVGNSKKEKTPVIVYPCHKGPNQTFRYNRKTQQIRSASTGKCVDISSSNRIYQRKCNPRKKTQKWKPNNGRLVSMANNKKCLDIEGAHYGLVLEGSKYEAGVLIAWPCHNGPNQKFAIQ